MERLEGTLENCWVLKTSINRSPPPGKAEGKRLAGHLADGQASDRNDSVGTSLASSCLTYFYRHFMNYKEQTFYAF
jgi:hypothetical protein